MFKKITLFFYVFLALYFPVAAWNTTTGPISASIPASDYNTVTKGTAIRGDYTTDPDTLFSADTGIAFKANYDPRRIFRVIEIRGGYAGQDSVTVKVAYLNGSITTHRFSVTSHSVVFLEGWFRGIYAIGTTARLVFPFF